jgi:hypothetical protein
MKTNSFDSHGIFRSSRGLTTVALAAIMLLVAPVAGFTQETTGSVRGTVLTPNMTPSAGEQVTVTDTRTGSSRTVTTNDAGAFNIRGLTIGGPYTIRVDSNQYEDHLVTDVYTNLSAPATFTIGLQASDAAIDEIVVVSRMVETAALSIGPGSAFSLAEIEELPSVDRQIRDVVRIDPRVNIAATAGGDGSGMNCMGGSARSNAFTIDGIRAADGYGLNEGSGNATRNVFPIPFDTVASASVEFAPLDVQYSQFTGCNVNIVTKSGTNEFHGSAFYLFNDDSMTGDSLEGDKVITDPFEDTNWGFEIGGPIIKDKLFFYAAYEETDDESVQSTGCIDCGFANEDWITATEAQRIEGIIESQYDRQTLGIQRVLPGTSERTFLRLDWNINDDHRLEATYTDLTEQRLTSDGMGFDGFTFGDNFQWLGSESEAASVRLFSNWTDNFSTEIRFSTLDVTDIQDPQGGGEAQDDNKVRLIVEDGMGDVIFSSGPGRFRSANALEYTTEQFKIAGDYVIGDHTITAGYELETRDIFNLFIDNGTGFIEFADIDALEAGTAFGLGGNGSFTGDPRDAGATFGRDIHSFYVQDEWQLNDAMTLIAGLRYDTYDSSDIPTENPVFEQRYGFSNTQGFDGLELVQPRIGLTYDLPYDRFGNTQVSVGFGVFGGGDPTVHFANSYQNFGGAIGGGDEGDCMASDLQVINASGQFTGLPACVTAAQIAQATTNTAVVAAVDPNFDLPANHRWNFGISHLTESDFDFLNDWDIRFDYIYTDHKNATNWLDLTLTPNGVTLPDGRPQFMAVDPLLEEDIAAGRIGDCMATFNGPGLGFSNAGGPGGSCDAGRDDQDILMTNGPEGSTTSISLQLSKLIEFSARTSLDLRFGYAYTDAEVGNGINSSTQTSSFEEVAVAVINDVKLGPAMWANKHNFVMRGTLKHFFMEAHPTSFTFFLRRRSGRPFSFVYDNNTPTTVFGDSDNEERNLLYVPTGIGDPRVNFSGMTIEQRSEFFSFLERTGLDQFAGGIAPKNGFNQPWATDLDIRIQQDIPLPWADHSFKVFLDVENVLNIFSDSNNVNKYISQGDVEEAVPVLDATLSADGSQFNYFNFNPGGGNSSSFGFDPINVRDVDDSVYRVQLGVRYSF